MQRALAPLPSWVVATALVTVASGCLLDAGPYDTGGALTTTGTGATASSGPDTRSDTAAGASASTSSGTASGTGAGGSTSSAPQDVCDCNGCVPGVLCFGCGIEGGDAVYQDPASEHCYLVVPQLLQRGDARTACAAWYGADLVAPSTQAEMVMLLAATLVERCSAYDPAYGRCWTGGDDHDDEGTFIWLNGEPWLDEGGPKWALGEPNGSNNANCVVVGSDGALRDRECKDVYPFICERAP